MKKSVVKVVLVIIAAVMLITAFAACEEKQSISVDFISNDIIVDNAMSVEEAKELLASQPSMDGYVFKGWFLDKDKWTQQVLPEDVEDYITNGKLQVYAYWVKIVDGIVITFYNYNGAYLWEQEFNRDDVDLTFIKAGNKPDDEMYTYTFSGWDCDMSDLTQTHYIATPVYTKELRTFNVDYIIDGEVVYTQKVKYGEDARTNELVTPKKESTAQYDYLFGGWEGNKENITKDCQLVAKFHQIVRKYDVIFNFGNNKTVTQKVEYGKSAQAPTEDQLAKESTEKYDFVFVGWDNAFDCITSDTVVNAVYTEILRSFVVDFCVDDDIIKSQTVLYGQSAQAPEKVFKVEDDGYSYEFIGWDKSFDNITEDIVVNALFDQIAHTYLVKYVNWDGEILFTDEVLTSQSSAYEGEIPTREANDRYTYNFIGWTNSEALQNVTKDITVYAEYESVERTFEVAFNYGHEQRVVIENVPYGTDLTDRSNQFGAKVPTDTYKSSTAQYDFTFIDWNRYFGYISCDMEIDAIYKETVRKYIVTFINDGNIVKTQEVEYGSCPVAPELVAFKNDTAQYDYTYLGWGISENDIVENEQDFVSADPNNTAVEGEITYTAVYLREIQQYTVAFFNDKEGNDYTEVARITVPYGTNLADPENEFYPQIPVVTKDSTVKYDYTFAGWDKDLSFVQSDMQVYSTYTSTVRKYSVKFMNGDDVWAEYSVEYGAESPIPEDPSKQSTAEFDFVFIGWIGNTKFIEGDTTIEANYRNDLRYYEVSFYNLATNQFIETIEMGYGSSITKKIEMPGYTFDSWYKDPYCNNVFDMNNSVVEGKMTLFGNAYMTGLLFNANNEIIGYEGTESNLIIPAAANGRKVKKIVDEAFMNNTVIKTAYIPSTIEEVGSYVFSGVEIAVYTQKSNIPGGNLVNGWSSLWYLDHNIISGPAKDCYFNIEYVYYSTDYRYLLVSDGTAIIGAMINNNTARAYIDETVTCDLSVYTETTETDEKTGIVWNLYNKSVNTKTYNINQIGKHAYANCTNLKSIFIPNTIGKVQNYAFSGVSANIYIQRDKPIGSEIPLGWGINWNKNDGDAKGTRVIYWGVIGMEQVGDIEYIFMNDQTAVAAKYMGSSVATSVEVPAKVSYQNVEYTVSEIGAELFANMSLLNTVKLNEGLQKIGDKAFYMDIVLANINIPSTVTDIGAYAFVATNALKEIYIPAAAKVGTLCFAGSSTTIYCGREKEPTIFDGFGLYWNIKLGFEDISKLTSIEGIWGLVTNPTYLPTYYNVAGVYFAEAEEYSGFRKTTFKYMLYNDKTAHLVSYDNVLTIGVENYSIPQTIEYNGASYTVNTIEANAFNGCGNIKNLFVPSTVANIGDNAFGGCSNLTINTSHTAQPGGWHANFNPLGRPVNYNQAG